MDASLRDRAVDQAYRDHAPEVYRVAFGVLRDRDEALDATHDAFARAWERWDQYDAQRPLRAWLHGIVIRVALDQLRRPAGVFVFDTSSLAQVAHWNATADFVSLAVSSDGRYVYAAGSPQSTVGGTASEQAASITVFDAENGSVRLIAGQLGSGFLLLPSTTVK